MKLFYQSIKTVSLCMLIILGSLSFGYSQSNNTPFTNAGFEDGLTGWTGSGASISTGTTLLNWNIQPADNQMVQIIPATTPATAQSALGLTGNQLSNISLITNVGYVYRDISLSAGQSITMHWNYVSTDYDPYDDGTFATLTGPGGHQQFVILVRTVSSGLIAATGSYGSSGWHTVTLTAGGSGGTYRIGFGSFNVRDHGVNPYLFVDNAIGGTSSPQQPIVSTTIPTSITNASATAGGSVTNAGSGSVSARGILYSSSNTNPQIGGANVTQVSSGSGLGTFTVNLTGLSQGQTYYVRAYATNSSNLTAYGGVRQFTTLSQSPPTVQTGSISSVTNNSASGQMRVTADGGSTISEYGVVWSTGTSPTTSNSKASTAGSPTINQYYSFSLTSLNANTTYYVRGFATNPAGTSYGGQTSFKTAPNPPLATAATLVGSTSFRANWNASSGAIKYYLDVSTNSGFSTFLSGFQNLDVGNVTSYNLTGLTSGATYYYRLRADNGDAISGNSNTISLTTKVLNNFLVEYIGGGTIGTQTAGVPFNVRITARDSDNLQIIDYVGNATISSNADLTAGATTANFTGGVLTSHSVTLELAGTAKTLTASAGLVSSNSNEFIVLPGPINYYTIVANPHPTTGVQQEVVAGVEFSVKVTVYDEFGNLKTNYDGLNDVQWLTTAGTSPDGRPRIIPANGVQDFDEGVALISGFTFYRAYQDAVTITITDGLTLSPGTTDYISVVANVLNNFLVEEEPAQNHTIGGVRVTAGSPFSVKVTARDQYNNTKRDYVGHINFKSSNDAIVQYPSGLQQYTSGHQGVRTFTGAITIPTVGHYWLRVADSPDAFKTGDLQNIVVGPGTQDADKSELFFTAFPSNLTYPLSNVVAGDDIAVTLIPRDYGQNLLCDCQTVLIYLNGIDDHRTGTPVGGVPALQPIQITDHHDGSYTALVRVTDMSQVNNITASVNGTMLNTTLQITINEPAVPSLLVSTLTAGSNSITTDQNTVLTLQLKDQYGNNRTSNDGTMTFTTDLGGFGANNGNTTVNPVYAGTGAYTATLYASYNAVNHGVGNATITTSADFTDALHTDGTFDDNEIVAITEGLPNLSTSTITAAPTSMTTDESSTITVQLKDHLGNLIQNTRGEVTLDATIGLLSSVDDNEDGTYTATLTGDTRGTNGTGTSSITGSFAGDVSASSVSGAFTDDAEVEITEGLPALTTIDISTADAAITADETTLVTVQLKDQFGNLIVNDRGTITLSVSPIGVIANGSITGNSEIEANYISNGSYTATFLLNAIGVGTATITGKFDGNAITDNAEVAVTHGVATHLAFDTEPALIGNTIAGIDFNAQPVVSVRDQFGNLVNTGAASSANMVVSAISPATATLQGTTTIATVGGIATYTDLSYNKAEDIKLEFASSSLELESSTITVVHNIPTYMAITAAAPVPSTDGSGNYELTAGVAQNITVSVYDAYDNLATRFDGNQDITFSGAANSPAPPFYPEVAGVDFGQNTSLNFTDGQVTVSMILYKEEITNIAANCSIPTYNDLVVNGDVDIDAAGTDRLPVNVSQSIPAYFEVSIDGGLENVIAGTSHTIYVKAFDQYNNPATNYSGTKSLVFSGAGVSPAPSTNPTVDGTSFGTATSLTFDSNGEASATMILYKAETGISITAEDATNSVSTGIGYELDLNVLHGAANYFAVTGTPGAMTAGTNQVITVTAYDTWNNLATDYAGDKTIVFSGAIPSPDNAPANGTAPTLTNNGSEAVNFGNNTVMTFTAGVATGTMSLYREQEVYIVATEGSITSPVITGYDYRLNVNVGHAAANYFAVTGTTHTMTAGDNQTITVTLYDQFNNIATTYDGPKDLTFSGASVSELGNAPTMETIAFGTTTSMTFADGVTSGTMYLYTAEEAAIKVTNGTQTTSNDFDWEVTVSPAAAHNLAITTEPAHSTTEAIAGVAFSTQPVVRIRDLYGNLVVSDNTTVISAETGITGTANLFGTLTATASGGIATFSGLNYQKAENMNILFSSGSLQDVTSTTLTVVHNVPTYMVITGSGTQTAGVAQTITVTAYDAYDNVALRFAGAKDLIFSGASVSPVPSTSPTVAATNFGSATALTFTNGVATGSMLLYKEETAYIEASHADAGFSDSYTGATNLSIAAASPNGLEVVVSQAAPAYFAISGSGTQTAGTSQTITIRAYDTFNNLATNYTGGKLLRFSGASPSLAPSTNPAVSAIDFGLNTAITFNNGVASGDMHLYKSEEAEILATEILGGTAGNSNGTNGITTRVDILGYVYHLTVDVSPNVAYYFAVTGNGTQIAGDDQTITVTAYDQWNNVATGFTGAQNITFSGASDSPDSPKTAVSPSVGGASFGTATSLTFTAGVATGSMILTKVEIASVKATQGSVETPNDYALGVEVSHAANYYFAVTGSSTQTAGVAQTIAVTMYDAYNNIATSYDGSKSLTFDGAVASLYENNPTVNATNFGSATTVEFSNGIANTASMILTKAVSTTVTVSGDGINTATGLGLTVDVTHNLATNLRIDTEPSTYVRAGDYLAQQPIISIRDAYGNLVVDNTTEITASANGGQELVGTSTIAAVGGIVEYSGLNYELMETISITFTSDPVLTSATSNNIQVDHNATSRYEFTTEPAFIIAGGQRGAYVVTRYDAYGNLVNNLVVSGSDSNDPETVYLYTDGSTTTPFVSTFHNALTAGSVITSVDIVNGATTANFWYYSTNAGEHFIAGSDNATAADGINWIIDAEHNTLEVRPAALSHFNVYNVGGTANVDGWTEHYYGDRQTVIVEAIDILGNIKTNYTGTITFNLTDAQATVGTNYPSDYTFTTGVGADNGVHTFTDAILFTRPSFEHPSYPSVDEWWVTVVDQAQPSKFGSQVKIKVLARPITITADAQTKEYYGDTYNLGTTEYTVTSGLTNIYANSESVTSVTLTSTGTAATALAGQHDIVPSNATGTGGFNPDYYNITYTNGTLTVEPRPITIAVDAGQSKVYSTTDPTFTYQITSTTPFDALVNGDVFDGLLTRQVGENVANNYLISQGGLTIVNGGDNKEANYDITFVTANFEITPWPLVLSSFNASDKTYDATTTAALTFSDDRPIGGDEITFSTTANFSDRHVNWNVTAQPKDVAFDINISGGAQSGNYIISSANPNTSGNTSNWTGSTTATINQRPINVTAQTVSRIYDGSTDSYNLSGPVLPVAQTGQLVGTDAVSNVGIQTYDDANVGENKTLTPSGTIISDDNIGNNYAINYVPQNLGEITKREITVAISGNPTKVYDATTVATLVSGDYTIGNLVSGESITINQTSGTYNSVNVGTTPDRTVSVTLAEANYVPGVGTLLSNYTLPVSATGDGTITPYPITLSNFAAANKTYDGTTPTTITFNDDVIGSDVVTFGYSAYFSNRNVYWVSSAAGAKTVSYTVVISGGAQAGNYLFDVLGANTGLTSHWMGTTTATINQRPITVAVTAGQNKTYGDNDPASYTATVSGLAQLLGSGDQISGAVDARVTGENVGNYAIERGSWKIIYPAGSNADMEDNYAITFTPADFEITRLAITLTPTAGQDKIYGESDPLPFTYTTDPAIGTTLANGMVVALSGDLSRDAGEVVGFYNILQGAATNATNGNYNITFTPEVKFEIERKNIEISVTASQNKEYGDANLTYTYSTTPAVGALPFNASFIGALVREAGENVATDYTITQGSLELEDDNNATTSLAQNYNVTFHSADFAITRKAIEITVTSGQQKVYGESDPVFTFTTDPALASLPFQAASWSGALVRETGEVVASDYTITQGTLELIDGENGSGGSLATNYTVTFNTADFEITRKPITITVDAGIAKTYGDNDPAFTFTSSPELASLPFGAAWTGNLVRLNISENVATYAITQGSLELTDINNGTASLAQNYTVNFVGDNLTINKRDITITVTAGQNKVYAETDPVFAYSSSISLYYNGSFTGALTRATGENVANNYAIGRGNLQVEDDYNATSLDDNYNLNFVAADFEITKKPITITVVAGQSKRYGFDDPISSPTAPIFFKDFEFESSVDPLPFGGTFIGTLERTGLNTSPVGTYPISRGTLNIEDGNNSTTSLDANYAITFTGSNFTINERLLTLIASPQTKTYGFGPEAGSGHPDYWVIGNTLFTVDGSAGDGLYSTETVTNVQLTSFGEARLADVDTYDIGFVADSETGTNGFVYTNYDISYTLGTLTVEPRTLILSNFAADNKIYDGTNVATGLGFDDNRIPGDNLAFTRTAVFTDVNAGTNKVVEYTSIQISGGTDQNNYVLEDDGFGGNPAHWQTAANRTIYPREVVVTADDVEKASGTILSDYTGSTAFTIVGLQNGETAATVDIQYGPAAGASTVAGTYTGEVLPSNFSGGTFDPNNYTFVYNTGDIIVYDELSGYVYYYQQFGFVNVGGTWQGLREDEPIPNASVNFYNSSDQLIASSTTDAQGRYTFNSNNGPENIAKIQVNANMLWNGVTANDALAMQLRSVNNPPSYWQADALLPFNVPYLNRVGNVDGSTSGGNPNITVIDVLNTKFRILNPGNTFVVGDWIYYGELATNSWPLTRVTGSNEAAYISGQTLVGAGLSLPNFFARAAADMDGDYVFNSAKNLIPLHEGEVVVVNDYEWFNLDIQVKDPIEFSAMSMNLTFDDTKLEVQSLSSYLEGFDYVIDGNEIRVVWTQLQPENLYSADALFTLKARTLQPVHGLDNILFVNDKYVFGNAFAEFIPGVKLIAPRITTQSVGIGQFDENLLSLKAFPNPFRDHFSLVYDLPGNAHVAISLVDVLGVEVAPLINQDQAFGSYQIDFQASERNLQSGVYTIRMFVTADGITYTKQYKLVYIH